MLKMHIFKQLTKQTQISFFKNRFHNNIKLVSQLYNKEGTLFSYDEFLFYCKIPITQLLLVQSLQVLTCRGINKDHSPGSASLDVTKSYIGKICFSLNPKSNNRAIHTLFQREIVTVPYVLSHWTSLLNGKLICWRKVWLLPQKYYL